jgi:hypothetical protein
VRSAPQVPFCWKLRAEAYDKWFVEIEGTGCAKLRKAEGEEAKEAKESKGETRIASSAAELVLFPEEPTRPWAP